MIAPRGTSVIVNLALLKPHGNEAWRSLFQTWSRTGAVIHYLSAETWQFYPQIAASLEADGLPAGVLHMKSLSIHALDSTDGLLALATTLAASPSTYNAEAIELLMQRFPERRFILIGDEKTGDVAIYAEIARRHPQQIEHIWMLHEDGRRTNDERDFLTGIPLDRWTAIKSSAEIHN